MPSWQPGVWRRVPRFFDVRDAHHYASTVDWESSEDLRREWAEPAEVHAKRATSANSWAANEKHSRSQWRDAKWADEGVMTSIADADPPQMT